VIPRWKRCAATAVWAGRRISSRAASLRSVPMTSRRCDGRPTRSWSGVLPGTVTSTPVLAVSGMLDTLLRAGLRYAFVSNSDNLGALADVRIAAWMAAEQVPFALEAVRGTPAGRNGGHLACYRGRLVLRETAQVPDGDTSFTDVERWRWYNTNNIWIDLRALADLQAADPAAPDLPLIVNRETVDPSARTSWPRARCSSPVPCHVPDGTVLRGDDNGGDGGGSVTGLPRWPSRSRPPRSQPAGPAGCAVRRRRWPGGAAGPVRISHPGTPGPDR